MQKRWQNQEEAFEFATQRKAVMLDMDMGTGKTRVAIDVVFSRDNSQRILVVCPKSITLDRVWETNLEKFAPRQNYAVWNKKSGSVKKKAEDLKKWLNDNSDNRQFVIINYDSVWRGEMGDLILKSNFDTVILDESHRAKAAGSKVSKYLALLGKRVKYRMCLSGTPMANSPLDVYGQYRFLDPTIFGTNHGRFLDSYAVMGGPERRFIVGFKNQKELNEKFKSIAYTCKMSDVAERIKLPEVLPTTRRIVKLPSKDMKTLKELGKEFVAECGSGHVIVNNALTKMLRMQQISSGFCVVREDPFSDGEEQELNTAKGDALCEYISDISPLASVVVFCIFRHDIRVILESARKMQRKAFEISGSKNELDEWKQEDGAILVVQIQAGAEGIDMTKAHHAIYFNSPHSLAQYNQSKARLYRPGQRHPVSFTHLIAENTIDEAIFESLEKKEDIIDAIKSGSFNFGYVH